MADIFELSNLNAALGEKCQDPTVKRGIITSMMYQPKFENRIEVLEDAIDEIPLPIMQFGDPLAPLANAENVTYKTGIVEADAQILKVRDCIMAIKIVPWKLRATYLGFLAKENLKQKANKQDPFYMPFEDFVLMKLSERATEVMYMNAIFKGVRNSAGTTSTDLMDGYLKKITDAITATDLSVVATGAITSANVYAKLLEVYDSFSEAQKQNTVNIHVSPVLFDWMQRIMNPLTNTTTFLPRTQAELMAERIMNAMPLAGTNAILFREPGMATSQRIIATAPNNLFLGFHNDPSTQVFEIQKEDLTLKVLFVFKAGAEIGLVKDAYQALKVNNQA
jgi:hypothetical protein